MTAPQARPGFNPAVWGGSAALHAPVVTDDRLDDVDVGWMVTHATHRYGDGDLSMCGPVVDVGVDDDSAPYVVVLEIRGTRRNRLDVVIRRWPVADLDPGTARPMTHRERIESVRSFAQCIGEHAAANWTGTDELHRLSIDRLTQVFGVRIDDTGHILDEAEVEEW